jgi:hypothetical protein
MLSSTFRTLLIAQDERPPLEEIARETKTQLRRRGRGAFTLVFRDGSSAMLNFWRFERPQDHVSKTVLAMAAHFRERPLRGDAKRRRDRILLRVRKSTVSVVVGVRRGELSACALQFVDALAKRTDAIVYDFTSLRRANKEKLLDIHGYVTEDVPSDYPVLPKVPKRPEVKVLTEVPFALVWVPEEEALRTDFGTPTPPRILIESKTHREELVKRILELGERIGRVKVSPEAKDRRTRLTFEVPRATALIEASDLPAVAGRLHGITFTGAEARDEVGRLVLSTSGAHDPRALSPREVVVFVGAVSSDVLRRVDERLSSRGLTVSCLRHLDDSSCRIESQALEFTDMRMKLRRRALVRHARILQFFKGASPIGIKVSSNVPMDLEQLGEVLRCARSLRGVTFDGWGFYDHRGRALLVRSGALDPAARFLKPVHVEDSA